MSALGKIRVPVGVASAGQRHTCRVDVIQQIWQRASTPDAAVSRPDAMLIAVAAVGIVVLGWVPMRRVVTVVHEAGHGVAALLVGRRVAGIRVHPDASGLTLSRGRPDGWGMVVTLFAGYVSPSLLGLGLAWMVSRGRSALALWLLVLALAVLLVSMRNLYGALIVVLCGLGVVAGSWFLPVAYGSVLVCGLAWLMLMMGPIVVVGLFRGTSPTSDPGKLAAITHIPQPVWVSVWLLCGVLALWQGGLWLLNVAG